VAAAIVAALRFRVAVHPEGLHDPEYERTFAADRVALPALGAVRLRTSEPHALHLLQTAPGASFDGVHGPARAASLFRYGRLLYATTEEIDEVLARLRSGEPPRALPPTPDVSAYYRDARGPYDGDVVLAPGATPEAVREILPDARLSGEPVAREAEARDASSVARALLLALFALGAWSAWRHGLGEAERRLLAALLALAALGLSGLGIDRWSVVAVVLVAGAPRGAPLLAALPCAFFPALALRRLALVLCVGGVVRLRRSAVARRPGFWRPAVVAVVAALAGFLLLHRVAVKARVHPAVAAEAAAVLVPPDAESATAAELRAEGFEVVGDEDLVPPPADRSVRRKLIDIFTLARRLADGAEGGRRARFEDVADAAARDALYLPRDLRVRLRARDGRSVLWLPRGAPPERAEFRSARLYRERGELDLRRSARLAAILVFLLYAVVRAAAEGAPATWPAIRRFAAAAAALALVLLVEARGAGVAADVLAPLLVVASLAPALGTVLALGAAALVSPDVSLWPAAAFALAGLIASRRRPRSSSLPSSPA